MSYVRAILLWILTRGRLPVSALLALVSLLMAFNLGQLRVEQDTRSMTSSQPAQLEAHERLRALFGHDENLLLSVTPPQLVSENGLDLVADLTSRISELDGVRQVFSLIDAQQPVHGLLGVEIRPLVSSDTGYANASAEITRALQANPQSLKMLISTDQRTAGLVIEPIDRSAEERLLPALIRDVRQLMTDYSDRAELHLTGVGVQKKDVADFIKRDQQTVLPLVVLVLTILLAAIFRRPSGVLLPLSATALSLVWTMGLYSLCGFELNTISSLLPPVVMILTVSNCIHLYNGWLHIDGPDSRRIELWADRVEELLTPCFFTALTTAVGLLSLTISSVPAVRQFGLFSALGVMFSLLISLTLVPIGLSFLPLTARHPRSGTGVLRHLLERIAHWTINRPAPILMVAALLLGLSLLGLPRLQNNTNLVGFLRANAPLAVDTAYIDRHLAGVNALEFMLTRNDGGALDSVADYAALERFEQLAREQKGVSGVFSILPGLRQLHRAVTGDDEPSLPTNSAALSYELELLSMADNRNLQQRFLTADRVTARISIRLHDVGSRVASETTNQLLAIADEIFGPGYRLVPTGSYYQIVLDSNRLVSDMLKSFSLTLTLVILIILMLLRSFRLTLLALIPNIVPIVWTLGLMGFCRIDLSTGTAMIGAVAFGLAVDDTIHYLVHYRRVLTGSAAEAVQVTTTRIGRALMITSLVLALGFWVGCFGSFMPTIYFSLLVGVTLLGALLCDLLVLPACLILGSGSGRKVSG